MNSVNILNNIFNEGKIEDFLGIDNFSDIANQIEHDKQYNDGQGIPSIIAGNVKTSADTVDALRDLLGSNVVDTSSIIRKARNSILQFPVYISNNIPIKHARVIANLFEHLYLTYAQTVLSQNKIVDIKDTPDLKFLKKIHTNLKESVGQLLINPYYKPIDEIDAMLEECKYNKVQYENGNSIEFSIYPSDDKDLIYECREMMHDPLEGFSFLSEANVATPNNNAQQPPVNPKNNTNNNTNQKNNNQNKPNASPNVASVEAPKMVTELNDIRKINDLQPTMMVATFKIKSDNGSLETVRYIVGVKAVLHVISAKDLTDEIRDIVMGSQRSLQKVRYKTGEISFLDYMFNINSLKSDAFNTTNINKRWISTLKRLSEFKKNHGSFWKKGIQAINGGDVPIPNGTLVLTNVDVEYIADVTGIDLDSVTYAKRLANNLYLIAVGILNGESSFKYFLPDQQSNWDVLSLSSINTTLARLDNTSLQKELGKIINNSGNVNR